MMRLGVFGASFGAAILLAGCSRADEAVWFPKDGHAKMDAATAEAQKTLPVFWRRIYSGDPAITEALVKVRYPTKHGGTEDMWMALEGRDQAQVRGVLANEPEDVPNVHEGQHVTVEISRITDWAYRKGDRYYGQYTTRVMLELADEKTRKEQSEMLAPTPLEPETN